LADSDVGPQNRAKMVWTSCVTMPNSAFTRRQGQKNLVLFFSFVCHTLTSRLCANDIIVKGLE